MKTVIDQYATTFTASSLEFGIADVEPHRIVLKEGCDQDLRKKLHRLPVVYYDWTQREVNQMLAKGVISQSHLSASFPIIVVPQKDLNPRMCVDYRDLNLITEAQEHVLPKSDVVFEWLTGMKYFSSRDMKAGYWQIPIALTNKWSTTFGTPWGLYEFNVMPYGLTNATTTFQRCMNKLMKDLIGKGVYVYLDDILIYSKTFEEHLTILTEVLKRLEEANMKLNATNCQLFKKQVEYLGHVITTEGMDQTPS